MMAVDNVMACDDIASAGLPFMSEFMRRDQLDPTFRDGI
jgi:hypothetical protein